MVSRKKACRKGDDVCNSIEERRWRCRWRWIFRYVCRVCRVCSVCHFGNRCAAAEVVRITARTRDAECWTYPVQERGPVARFSKAKLARRCLFLFVLAVIIIVATTAACGAGGDRTA